MAAGEHDIQIDLEGIIQLLARNLYADTDVFLREMLQNAHDSIFKRRELADERGDTPPEPRIDVEIDRHARIVRIRDNGSGLTRDEIHTHLSTIGRSGTRELRESLEGAGRTEAVELIGQFGIGLLSAFLVAEQIDLVTRAAGSEAVRWRSSGSKTYTVEAAERDAVGTTISLTLSDAHPEYLRRQKLVDIVRRYADFIGVPVRVDGGEPVNAVHAPWDVPYDSEAAREAAHRAYWQQRFESSRELTIVPLDEPITWREGGKEQASRLAGVIGIDAHGASGPTSTSPVALYVRNMFITDRQADLLPAWAQFIRGVVQCDALRPNAARDDVMRDEVLAAVRDAIGRRLVKHLTELARDDRRQLVAILRLHAQSILPVCVRSDETELFHAVADLLPLRTEDQPMTVRDYLEHGDRTGSGRGVVYYVCEPQAMNQYRLLSAARGVHVFDASEPYAEQFLQRYATIYPERIELRRLDADENMDFIEAVPADDQMRFRALQTAADSVLDGCGHRVEVARFQPAELPALIVDNVDTRRRREMESIVEDVGLPSFLSGAVGDMLQQETEPALLYLNADNPTVRELARRAPQADDVVEAGLRALYGNATLLSGRRLEQSELRQLFEYNTRLLDLLLASDAPRQQ